MPLELTNAQRRNLDARRSDDQYLQLVTFRHRDLSAPIRIAKNGADVESQGHTFRKGWFELELPTDKNEPPKGRISVPNIDRQFSALLLRLRRPPRVQLQAVLRSAPDTVIENYDKLFMRGISGDANFISGTLDSWNFTTEPWPARSGNQARCPALWVS